MITLYHADSPSQSLVNAIQSRLNKSGLYLYRYQTNSRYCAKITRITYAIHNSPIRPIKARLSSHGSAIVLFHIEGKTDRCESFRELNSLAQNLDHYLEHAK